MRAFVTVTRRLAWAFALVLAVVVLNFLLIRLASGFEAKTRHRRPPTSTPPLAGERFDY